MTEYDKASLASVGATVTAWESPLATFQDGGALIYSAAAAFFKTLRPDGYHVVVPEVPAGHPLRLPILARYGCPVDESSIPPMLELHGVRSNVRLDTVVRTIPVGFADRGLDALLDAPVQGLADVKGIGGLWRLPDFTMLGISLRPPPIPMFPRGTPEYELENRKHARLLLVTGDDSSISDLCLYWTLVANRIESTLFPLWIPLRHLASAEGRQVLSAALSRASQQPAGRWEAGVLYALSTSAGESEIAAAIEDGIPKTIVTRGFADFVPAAFKRGIREELEVLFEEGRANLPIAGDERLQTLAEFDSVTREVEVRGYRLPQLASLRHSVFGVPWRITSQGFESFSYAGHADQLTPIHLPSTWTALAGFFSESNYECAPSDKGRLAAGVLELLGTLDDLGILTSSKLFRILSRLAEAQGRQYFRKRLAELKPALEAGQVEALLKTLASAELSEQSRDLLSYSDFVQELGREAADATLTWLLEKRIVFRGAELTCPVCGLRRWYIIDRVGSEFLCDGCQKTSLSPIGLPGTNWRYRLNELYARAFDQGVLAHVLLAYQRRGLSLSERQTFLGFYPGLELKSYAGDDNREVDYVEISSGALVIGECRVAGSTFGANDAEKLASLARSLGCREVLVATASDLPSPEVSERLRTILTGEVTIYDSRLLFDKEPWDDKAADPTEYLERVARRLRRP